MHYIRKTLLLFLYPLFFWGQENTQFKSLSLNLAFADYFGQFSMQKLGVISTKSILLPNFASKIDSKELQNQPKSTSMTDSKISEEEALFFNRIADFWEEKELQIAKTQICEFLKLFPNSSYADLLHEALGDIFLKEKKYEESLNQYAKIQNPQISHRCLIHRFQCLYAMQWYTILAEECETYLNSEKEVSNISAKVAYYLAISLYHQCLNAEKAARFQIANKAKPYAEKLFTTSYRLEIGPVYAQICSFLEDFQKASEIYLSLAETDEEMLFQAAIAQQHYDLHLSLETFQKIINTSFTLKQQALLRFISLLFDSQKYEELLQKKEEFVDAADQDKKACVYFMAAKSFLALQKNVEACKELKKAIFCAPREDPIFRKILLLLIDASFLCKDLVLFDETLSQMQVLFSNDDEVVKAHLLKAQLYEKLGSTEKAKKELINLLETAVGQWKAPILLELIRMHDQSDEWSICKKYAQQFIHSFPNHPDISLVQSSLVAASIELAKKNSQEKQELIKDLSDLLSHAENLPPSTQFLWQYLLCKTEMALQNYERAKMHLETILSNDHYELSQKAQAHFLLAICYQETKDRENFCKHGEAVFALLDGNEETSLDLGSLHALLYNEYLNHESTQDLAAKHLLQALRKQIPIETKNLFWLIERSQNASIEILEMVLSDSQKKTPLEKEKALVALIQKYLETNQIEKTTPLLDELLQMYDAKDSSSWEHKQELFFSLGNHYLQSEMPQKALQLFEKVLLEKPSLQSEIGAFSLLQSSRLQMQSLDNTKLSLENPEFQKILSQLKTLVLQKNLSYEPNYLEASLDYIDFRCKIESSIEKKLQLLKKTKKDFAEADDILSKDYHQQRAFDSKKDHIYRNYMQFFDAQILSLESELENHPDRQKELQAKAKDLFLKIKEERAHPALEARVDQCLHH